MELLSYNLNMKLFGLFSLGIILIIACWRDTEISFNFISHSGILPYLYIYIYIIFMIVKRITLPILILFFHPILGHKPFLLYPFHHLWCSLSYRRWMVMLCWEVSKLFPWIYIEFKMQFCIFRTPFASRHIVCNFHFFLSLLA